MKTQLAISNEDRVAEEEIFEEIKKCIDTTTNFLFDAGAGSGKTYCLVQSLRYILSKYAKKLQTHNQKIRCITYTNIAAKEIKKRLGNTELVVVSTIHDFLWDEVRSYQEELVEIHKKHMKEELVEIEKKLTTEDWAKFYMNIEDKEAFRTLVSDNKEIYYKNKNKNAKDFKESMNVFDKEYLGNVSNFKKVVDGILKIYSFNKAIEKKKKKEDKIDYTKVIYNSQISYDRLSSMQFSHDRLIKYSLKLIAQYPRLQKIMTDKYPYILVDEYQDTNEDVISIITKLAECSKQKFVVGYYGDKKQNIYDTGIGDKLIETHSELKEIKKEYNRRSAKKIIEAGNQIRNDDLKQKTIYNDCPEGCVSFYVGTQIDDFITFHKKKWHKKENNKIDCLLLKNEDIANRAGFGKIYDFYKNSLYYKKGQRWKDLRDHILNKEPEKLGKIQSFLYFLIDFKNKIKNPNTLIKELIDKNVLKILSIKELRDLILKLQEIKGDTLYKYSVSFFKMLTEEKNNNIKNTLNAFINEECVDSIEKLKNYILDVLFNLDDDAKEDDLDEYKKRAENFFSLDISIFDNWYNYINDNITSDIIYHTYHGTKGDEFDNVLIIMEKGFGKTTDFFGNLIKNLSNKSNEVDKTIKSARNLFYVAVTRSIQNLSVLYTDTLDEAQECQIKKIFGEIDKIKFSEYKGAQDD